MTGITKRAILSLLAEMGCACAEYHNKNVRNLEARRVQGKLKDPTTGVAIGFLAFVF
jgi:hypothetical protein